MNFQLPEALTHKDVDNMIEKGDYRSIINWLKVNVYKYGRSLNAMQLVKEVTKTELSPNYFISYLKNKILSFS